MAAIFFDIDGTLIDKYGKIEESTVRGIQYLKENGHDVYINSGRTKVYIHNPELHEIGFDGLLCGCGTNLFLHGEEIYYQVLEQDRLHRMIEVCDALGMTMIVEGRDWLYMDKEKICKDPYGEWLYHTMEAHIRPIAGNPSIEGSKFTCVISGIPIGQIDEAMAEFQDEYAFANHDNHVLELTPKHCSKALAIREICQRTGVSIEDTFAFGDGVNDVEMLKAVKVGIAMGNARMPAKEAADYVTDDIHADGIWNALKQFGLIKNK